MLHAPTGPHFTSSFDCNCIKPPSIVTCVGFNMQVGHCFYTRPTSGLVKASRRPTTEVRAHLQPNFSGTVNGVKQHSTANCSLGFNCPTRHFYRASKEQSFIPAGWIVSGLLYRWVVVTSIGWNISCIVDCRCNLWKLVLCSIYCLPSSRRAI